MLNSLTIRHFTLVDHQELEIPTGFSVITGETGAGKSILLDALGLCLGDKADGAAVRRGADKADLTALFDVSRLADAQAWLAERELLHSDECSLRRVIHKEGRSKAWINGTPVTLGELRTLGEMLIHIHGQHAPQSLLQRASHRQLIDNVGDLHSLAADVAGAHQHWQQAARALADSEANRAAQAARLELLDAHLDELQKLGLKPGEYEALEQEYDRLANFESLMLDGRTALDLLSEGEHPVLRGLQQAMKSLEAHRSRDATLSGLCASLDSALIDVKESAGELRHFLEGQELDPERLQWLEGRLGDTHRLARKHKALPAELPALQERLQAERSRCQEAQDVEALQAAVSAAAARYQERALALREQRRHVAASLAPDIAGHLRNLGMPDTQVEFAFIPLAKPGANGLDDIELLFTANKGQAPQPLAKVVSGGELSRFALSVQVIQAQHSAVPVLVFDEVDVGISGGTAEVVGQLLRMLGERAQILCITHQPQVAAKGHQHWRVEKFNEGDVTHSRIMALSREERIREIARMSGGVTITPETLRHAESMLAG
jgi:DNA repair protein RecN (Recombination protein N)